MSQAAEHTANGDEQRPVTATPVDTDNRSSLSIQPTTNSDSRSSLREKGKGKVLGFLRSKKNRQAACKLKLTTRAGATVVIWTSSEECTDEWIRRLLDLRTYWVHRRLSDSSLRSQVCALNYMLQGRRSREKDMPDWNDEKAWADRAIWHACLVLGCRDIIISGMLYRKRHRHQGMRKVFCILTRGRLVEYKYPESPSSPPRSALADQANSVYTDSAGLLSGMASSTTNLMAGDPADPGSAGSSGNSKARLLFGRSRSLSLRRCYVMSRFIDDLTTQDIMCEPWVMTDISNYNGLRLADRLYADGVISHELVQDCIFTVWRPTFVPAILRSGKTPKIKTIPEEALGEISEESVDEQPASVGSEPKSSSPNGKSYPTAGQAAAVSFEPGSSTREHSDSRDRAMAPTALGIQVGESPSETGSSPQGSVRRQRPSADALRRSGEVTRKSNETSRISGDGYLSSMSNKSNGKPVDTSKPGAYRIGDKITVNVDDRHDGIKRMGAIGMVSSMRRRMGVYKARTSAEMEQWVTAINQEIRRMAAAGDW
ncbi:hypothetical protein GQ54DRAFT_264435 [Martensiomyces pterosporus]|nr:hypothetical protein GQ54DRAFT_264435 [Martensiomyces pterosporus]